MKKKGKDKEGMERRWDKDDKKKEGDGGKRVVNKEG